MDPEELFATWVEAHEAGRAADFDALLARHPEHAEPLRRMHSDWQHFAPILERVVPGSISDVEDAAGVPRSSLDDESRQPPDEDLIRRLGIQLPEAGRYRFRAVIGQGGGGVVLRVWDAKLRRPLAMKVVLGRGETRPTGDTPPVDAAVLTRFVDEARIASQLDHPGIVPVHELGTDASGRAFFTMRLVRGKDLGEIFKQARDGDTEWTQARLLGILVRVCEAVAYAHEKGVLHRDLKPANVMVGRHGEVQVMDWGLARVGPRAHASREASVPSSGVFTVRGEEREVVPQSPLLTSFGAAVGTPAYMAPEQARGQRIDVRTDVYAIGAILYELLAGEPPFSPSGADLHPFSILQRVLAGPPEPLAAKAPGAPRELVAICERAMAHVPRKRYPTVAGLARDLRAFLEGRVVKAFEVGAWAEARKWVSRNRLVAAALGVATLAVLGGGIGALLQTRRAERSVRAERSARTEADQREVEAHAERYRATMTSAHLAYRDGDEENLRRLLDSAPSELRNWEWGYLDAAGDPSHATLGGHQAELSCLTFSADGKRVLTGAGDGTAKVWETESWRELFQLVGHGDSIVEARFVSGGPIVTVSPDGTVRTWDAATGKPIREMEIEVLSDSGYSAWPVYGLSPDGVLLIAPRASGAPVLDTRTGEELARLEAGDITGVDFSPDSRRFTTGSYGDSRRIWDASTLELVLDLDEFRGDDAWYTTQLSPCTRWIFDWGDGNCRMIERATRAQVWGGEGEVYDHAFDQHGARIALALSDGRFVMRDAATGAIAFEEELEEPARILFAPDGKKLLCRRSGAPSLVLDAGSGDAVREIEVASNEPLEFSPDGSRVLGMWSGRLWDTNSDREPARLWLKPRRDRYALFDATPCFSPDGTWLLAPGLPRSARVYSTRDDLRALERAGEIERAVFGRTGVDLTVLPSEGELLHWRFGGAATRMQPREAGFGAGLLVPRPGGRELLVQHASDGCLVFDLDSGAERLRLGPQSSGSHAAYSPDGTLIATVHATGYVFLWDAETGARLRQLKHRWQPCEAKGPVAFWPGRSILIVFSGHSMTLWDARDGRRVASRAEDSEIETAAVADSGAFVLVMTKDAVVVREGHEGRTLWRRERSKDDCVAALFVGERVALCARAGDVHLLQARSGAEWLTLVGHGKPVRSIAVSPDGSRFVTAAEDGTVRLWDSRAGGEMLRLDTGEESPESVGFSPDGRWIHLQGERFHLFDGRPPRAAR